MVNYGFGKKTAVTLSGVIAIILGILLAASAPAHAKSSYLSSFNSTYGTSGTPLNSCTLCHPGGNTGNLNPFASAYRSAGHSFSAIASQDSDGDGFSNLAEIEARTFPGDSGSHPATTPPPTPPPSTPPPSTPPPAPADTTKPTAVSTNPADGAADVPVNASLKIMFSEEVEPLDALTFTLDAGSIPVAGTVTMSPAGTMATFQPSAPLAYGATYTATVTTGVTDLAGNALAQPFIWSFTTAAAPTVDADGDGIPDSMDGFPNDNRKATVPNPMGNDSTMIDTSMNAGTRLMLAAGMPDTDPMLNQAGKPAGYEFRHGVVAFQVAGLTPGGTASVALSFPEPIPADARIYKVDAAGFHEYAQAVVAGNTVTLTLVDGGAGDADGLANGVIDDPVAVAVPVAASTPGTPVDAAGGGGCSVAGTGGGAGGFANAFGFLALIVPALIARRTISRKK